MFEYLKLTILLELKSDITSDGILLSILIILEISLKNDLNTEHSFFKSPGS
jgi:hypothetical protein